MTQVSWSNNRGGSGTATGTTSWSAPVALQTGANVLTVTARDAAGNTKTASITVTLNTPPTLAIVANQSAVQGKATSLQLSGADADGGVLTYGGNGLADGDGDCGLDRTHLRHTGDCGQLPRNCDRVGRDADRDAHVHMERNNGPDSAVVRITTPTTATTFSTNAADALARWNSERQRGRHAGDLVQQPRRKRHCNRHDELERIGRVSRSGSNVLTVTARDAAGNMATDTIYRDLQRTGYDQAGDQHHQPCHQPRGRPRRPVWRSAAPPATASA